MYASHGKETGKSHKVHAARKSGVIAARSAMEDLSGTQDARRVCMCVVLAALGHLSSHHQRNDEGQSWPSVGM